MNSSRQVKSVPGLRSTFDRLPYGNSSKTPGGAGNTSDSHTFYQARRVVLRSTVVLVRVCVCGSGHCRVREGLRDCCEVYVRLCDPCVRASRVSRVCPVCPQCVPAVSAVEIWGGVCPSLLGLFTGVSRVPSRPDGTITMKAPVHPDEERRVQVLRGLEILDTGTCQVLSSPDNLAHLGASACAGAQLPMLPSTTLPKWPNVTSECPSHSFRSLMTIANGSSHATGSTSCRHPATLLSVHMQLCQMHQRSLRSRTRRSTLASVRTRW